MVKIWVKFLKVGGWVCKTLADEVHKYTQTHTNTHGKISDKFRKPKREMSLIIGWYNDKINDYGTDTGSMLEQDS